MGNKFLHIIYRSYSKPFEEYEEVFLNTKHIVSIEPMNCVHGGYDGFNITMTDGEKHCVYHGQHIFDNEELLNFIISKKMTIDSSHCKSE